MIVAHILNEKVTHVSSLKGYSEGILETFNIQC